MASTEAADKGKVVRDFEDLFDLVKLECTFAHIVSRIYRILDERSRPLEDVAEEEELRLEHVRSLAIFSRLAASNTILFLIEIVVVVHEPKKSFSEIGLANLSREFPRLQEGDNHQ